jgi:hypothetical protein
VKSTSISKPASSSRSPPGLVRLERPEAGPGHEAHDVGEHERLQLRHPHLRARRARHRGDRADVVEVRVREQDAVELHSERVDRAEQLVGLVSGVDDQRAVGSLPPEEVGVLLHGPDREHPHVHR